MRHRRVSGAARFHKRVMPTMRVFKSGNSQAVVALAKHETKVDQVALTVHEGHDLAGQSPTRAPDRLIASPPFAPVPSRWMRTTAPSAIT
jgi:hypothetical protein